MTIVELIKDNDDIIVPLSEQICDQLGWKTGDQLEVVIDDGVLIIQKQEFNDV